MDIVAALFVEGIDFRQVAGPSTRIDITGAFFSTAVDAYPAHLEPHLVVLVRAPDGSDGNATLETCSTAGEQIAAAARRSSWSPEVRYRLVKGELVPSRERSRRCASSGRPSVVVPSRPARA
jgi:hypothetical protein